MTVPSSSRHPIVFVHGLWLHGESWNPWISFFGENGYQASAATWPGDAESTAATRANGSALAGRGVTEIADHIARQINGMKDRPILIGHSFGGLLAQNLLGRGLAVAAIAIDPAPIQGVLALPVSALKAAFPALGNPLNYSRSVSLTEAQFRFAFTNAVSEPEAKELFDRYAMPAPARPLFQAATANFNPVAATKVNVKNATRGPLLLISGDADNTVPPAIVRSTFNLYRKSAAVTEMKSFANRGHSLTIDSGWRELASYCADWLRGRQL